ncbi:hypothetical protein ACFL0L_02625 [Patescibacteria group bacterium]
MKHTGKHTKKKAGKPAQTHKEKKHTKPQDFRQFRIIALIILVLIVGYAVYNYSTQEEETDNIRYTTVPHRTIFDTSSWDAYENEIYGFTFKIPAEWEGYMETRATQLVEKDGESTWSYNFFHYEYPKKLTEDVTDETGIAFFEIGVFSPTNWDKVKSEWTLLGSENNVFFGGRTSNEDFSTGLTDRFAEIEGIFQSFEL